MFMKLRMRVSPEPFITLRLVLVVFKHFLYFVYVILINNLYNFILLKYKIISESIWSGEGLESRI